MRIGSLCSGYGGLDLATLELFPGSRVAWHCETDRAAARILEQHWPGVPNHGDITAIDWSTVEPVDLITAGYPCQPFSAAGKRKGTNDERHLWPAVRTAIRELRPRLTLLENVAGHRSMGFDRVLGDLAEDGLHAWWCSLRAADVGACHGRERLFILVTDPGRDGREGGEERHGEPLRGVETPFGSNVDRRGDAQAVALLPTPSAADGMGGHLSRSGDRRHELLLPGLVKAHAEGKLFATPQARDRRGVPKDGFNLSNLPRDVESLTSGWGEYEPAVRRQESLSRPAPAPTQPAPRSKSGRHLLPAFSEWMMFLPGGWVTEVPGLSRTDQLVAIGNGVVPPQAVAAFRYLLALQAVA